MGRIEGKVAFITGVARGQGRSHAIRMAEEGADIIGIDLLGKIEGAPYDPATEEDLAETVREVENRGRRIIAEQGDVRQVRDLQRVVDAGIAEFGRLDIVVANAGIYTKNGPVEEFDEAIWDDMIATNLSSVWRTMKATVPYLKQQGQGGSIIIISSGAGLRGAPNIGHYVAAKHGLTGLMRTLAIELAPMSIRVNSIHPTQVDTPMIHTEETYRLFAPDIEEPDYDIFVERSKTINKLPVPWVESIDVSNAVLFLASDEARYITGVPLPVDAGATL